MTIGSLKPIISGIGSGAVTLVALLAYHDRVLSERISDIHILQQERDRLKESEAFALEELLHIRNAYSVLTKEHNEVSERLEKLTTDGAIVFIFNVLDASLEYGTRNKDFQITSGDSIRIELPEGQLQMDVDRITKAGVSVTLTGRLGYSVNGMAEIPSAPSSYLIPTGMSAVLNVKRVRQGEYVRFILTATNLSTYDQTTTLSLALIARE